ncbi:hypothetical protein MYX04_09155, partial [Nitrospiraceae bacterium AH_259_D15_M11_P09]|nr:hypothetical protein [Nitrospiraceae bacterium AH_259_D15_M11_P09]
VDTLYQGNVINNGSNPDWVGKLYRLTTGDPTDSDTFGTVTSPSQWGIASGSDRVPTVLIDNFSAPSDTKVGPIPSAPGVTLDDSGQYWLFFGTGRYHSAADKTNSDTQYLFGIKDPVLTGGCTQSTSTNCEQNDLVNVSGATICIVCTGGTTEVTGVSGVTTLEGTSTTTLQGLVQSKEGWFTTLPATRERALVSPTLIGGTVFFPTFITPDDSACEGSSGTSTLYALFYLTGTAYTEPALGTEVDGSGNTNAKRSIAIGGIGMASQVAIHIGGQGTGGAGAASNAGCAGRVTGFVQSSTGTLTQFCSKPALSGWSHYVSWIGERSI